MCSAAAQCRQGARHASAAASACAKFCHALPAAKLCASQNHHDANVFSVNTGTQGLSHLILPCSKHRVAGRPAVAVEPVHVARKGKVAVVLPRVGEIPQQVVQRRLQWVAGAGGGSMLWSKDCSSTTAASMAVCVTLAPLELLPAAHGGMQHATQNTVGKRQHNIAAACSKCASQCCGCQ